MRVRIATSKDLQSIDKWSGLKTEPAYTTFIIPGVCGASLVRTEANEFAFLNNLVTNPHVSRELRQRAIDALVAHIVEFTHNLHIGRLIAFTTNNSTIERAGRFGFERLPHTLLFKNLENT